MQVARKCIIGVSKRCCPACSALLLVFNVFIPFRILGSHRTITPWSLPPSLPNMVVEEVVKKLEEELRGVLAKVILKSRLEDQTRVRFLSLRFSPFSFFPFF